MACQYCQTIGKLENSRQCTSIVYSDTPNMAVTILYNENALVYNSYI